MSETKTGDSITQSRATSTVTNFKLDRTLLLTKCMRILGILGTSPGERVIFRLLSLSRRSVGIRYVLSLFEPNAVKNAVKKSTCSYVAFVPESLGTLFYLVVETQVRRLE
jgi:hypothetical protein